MIQEQGSNPAELAKAYADWASEPTAVPARRAALAALKTQAPPLARLSTLLSMVDAAAAPSETDPLWPETVQATAEVWNGENLQMGRDMMLAETRSRPRQLLVASLAQYASTDRVVAELSQAQKNGLRSDFIDVYRDQSPAQQKAMEDAVRNIAGEHAAALLRGIAATP
jgi:hypothetical protein